MGGRSGYTASSAGTRGVDLQRGKVHLLFRVLEELRDETSHMFLQAFGLSIGQRLYTISKSYGARVSLTQWRKSFYPQVRVVANVDMDRKSAPVKEFRLEGTWNMTAYLSYSTLTFR